MMNPHLVSHSSSSLERSLREALCFSSKRSFSLLAPSMKIKQTHLESRFSSFNLVGEWKGSGSGYRCLCSPWLWCRASAGSRLVPAVSPCRAPARSASWQSWWSYTSKEKERRLCSGSEIWFIYSSTEGQMRPEIWLLSNVCEESRERASQGHVWCHSKWSGVVSSAASRTQQSHQQGATTPQEETSCSTTSQTLQIWNVFILRLQ